MWYDQEQLESYGSDRSIPIERNHGGSCGIAATHVQSSKFYTFDPPCIIITLPSEFSSYSSRSPTNHLKAWIMDTRSIRD